ncbi:hypothetical protein FE338_00235 [Helicobacter pylori]|nr:hypothetical protein FE338_00235 [Helicobacter pylori]
MRAKPHTKPLLMAQSLFEAKAITISQLPLAQRLIAEHFLWLYKSLDCISNL